MISCSKEFKVEAPDFDVRVEKTTYKVGDTVRFHFSGSAENITFYSGKSGSEYEHRNRATVEGAVPKFSFATVYGSGRQWDNLRVMITTDIETLSKESIQQAHWDDLTDKAIMQRNGFPVPGNAELFSGEIDISDYIEFEKPFYLAFKHVGYTDPVFQVGTRLIRKFNVLAGLPDGSTNEITNLQGAGWTTYDMKNPNVNWVISFGSNPPDIRLIGGAVNVPEIEDWVVTKPLVFNRLTRVAADTGKPIQYLSSNVIDHYDFLEYNEPGTYNVTFVASNANVDRQKSVVKQLQITIEP